MRVLRRATRAASPLADADCMDEPTDILIPLLPPFLALLGQAADAQARGERAAHELWLAAAAHLHAVDADALVRLTTALVARQRTADALALAECAVRAQPGAATHFNHG
ncbi:hypothetical protein M3640_20760, partial [Bacillus velezensis]|nr:hypothetical protein [Bacillus velezensis]